MTLTNPWLKYHSLPDLIEDHDSPAVYWHASIRMLRHDDDTQGCEVGYVRFLTASTDCDLVDLADEISADTAEFCQLFTDLDRVEDQFLGGHAGVLILDKAFIDPAARGHYLGAWAICRVIHQMTALSSATLVLAYPAPTHRRPGVPDETARTQLARYWARAGLVPINAAPALIGHSTAFTHLEIARKAFADVTDLRLRITEQDLNAREHQP